MKRRPTVAIEPDLYAQLKALAADRGIPVTKAVEQLIDNGSWDSVGRDEEGVDA